MLGLPEVEPGGTCGEGGIGLFVKAALMGARRKGMLEHPNLSLKSFYIRSCSLPLTFMLRLSIRLEWCVRRKNEEIVLQEGEGLGYSFSGEELKYLDNCQK